MSKLIRPDNIGIEWDFDLLVLIGQIIVYVGAYCICPVFNAVD